MGKEDVVYINTMKYYSAIKKNGILPFVTMWVDLEGIRLSEISQKKTSTIRFHLYVESKKTKLMNKHTITKQKQTHRYREQTGGCQRGEGWRDE